LDPVTTRAVLLCRANALARGLSGVHPRVVELLLHTIPLPDLPRIPALGSVGASGDLTPLAHVALALMGESPCALSGNPFRLPTGFAPLEPTRRECLAIVNGTSATAALAALNHVRFERALATAAHIAAAYAEVTHARAEAWSLPLGLARPHPGQLRAHHLLQQLTRGSRQLAPSPHAWDDTQPLQDPYSARCVPQLLGALFDAADAHLRVVSEELNAASDNPLIDPHTGLATHGGNFFGQHLAWASDALMIALVTLANWLERVVARLVDHKKRPDLPPFLQPHRTGLHAGLMGAQVTASALAAALRADASPASIHSLSTNADNQDVVPMATLAAWRVDRAMPRLHELLSIAAITAAQAVSLAADPDAFGEGTRALLALVRAHSPSLALDRPLSAEILALATALDAPVHPLPS
jgi:tyrosine ammonia-lyase